MIYNRGDIKMSENNWEFVKVRTSPINNIFLIIGAFAGLMLGIMIGMHQVWHGLFIFLVAWLGCFGILKPTIDMIKGIKERKEKYSSKRKIIFFISIAYYLLLIYTSYKIVFTYPIIEDSLFWLYKIVIISAVVVVFGRIFFKLRKRYVTPSARPLKKPWYITSLGVALIVFVGLILIIVKALYKPIKTIELSNLIEPERMIIASGLDSREIFSNGLYTQKVIEDKEFREDFYRELKTFKATELSTLELINRDAALENRKDFFNFIPDYSKTHKIIETSWDIDKGYMMNVCVFRKDIVITTYKNNGHYLYNPRLFRIEGTEEFYQELQKTIRTFYE